MIPNRSLAALVIVPALWLPINAQAQELEGDLIDGDEQVECQSRATQVKGVATEFSDEVPANVDFSGTDGDLGPLLETLIRTSGRRSCVVAHFSAVVEPHDGGILFQALIDGHPMKGHATFPFLRPSVADIPVVFETIPLTTPPLAIEHDARMLAYTFFAEVERGEHSVEVLVATCCSTAPLEQRTPSVVRSAVLTLEYR